jgi:hypothetical protein
MRLFWCVLRAQNYTLLLTKEERKNNSRKSVKLTIRNHCLMHKGW